MTTAADRDPRCRARSRRPRSCKPARDVDGVEVVAVAARDRARAEKFAAKHGIPRVLDYYDAVIADPDIDAIYNPLPNGLHGVWTERALAAGKHVLCEKPFTANADEAATVAAAAASAGLVVMEAFHYRYHPVAQRMLDIVASRRARRAAARRDVDVHPAAAAEGHPVPARPRRRRHDGHRLLRDPHEPPRGGRRADGRQRAGAARSRPDVDRWMRAELHYPDGLDRHDDLRAVVEHAARRSACAVFGDRRRAPGVQPDRPAVRLPHDACGAAGRSERIKVDGAKKPTYTYQLGRSSPRCATASPLLTPPADSVANMGVVDAIYRAAGLGVREPSTPGA